MERAACVRCTDGMASRISIAAAWVALSLVPAACGTGPADDRGRAAGGDNTRQATIYFLTDRGRAALGVRRPVEQLPWYEGGGIRARLKVLLAGPTQEERRAGLTTALPDGTRIRSLTSRGFGGTGEVIDLAGLPADADALRRVRIITQVARTVIGVSGVRRIWIRSDGEPWHLWLMEGGIDTRPVDYDTLEGFNVCAAKPGTEAVRGVCFSALP